jgi:predicted helicase
MRFNRSGKFNVPYGHKPERFAITKRDIFHYTYAVLHHPAYRTKYEINLKREFPRLPFYADFRQWAAWGQSLMELHLNYEQAAPFPLERDDKPEDSERAFTPAKRQKT